jgi:dipeptidyl aminopeptidase/acylaminoacyl peptidase
MSREIQITEKYEFNGWPSIPRPDVKPPTGWGLPLIAAVNHIRSHTLSPAGDQLAFIWDREDLSDVYLMDISGGWPKRISTGRAPVPFWDDELPRWSPDGQWLAFTQDEQVWIAPRSGGLQKKITGFAKSASNPAWMPDSRGIVVSVERDGITQLVLTDLSGSWPRPLTEDALGDAWDARPSPDGKFIAYTHRPFNDLSRLDIRLIDLSSGEVRTLTHQAKLFNHSPRWRPGYQQLSFLSQRSGYYEIYLHAPDAATPDRLTHFSKDVIDYAWAPDGASLACIVNRFGAFELELVDVQSGQSTALLGGAGMYTRPEWAPDGRFLTFEHENPLQPPDIYRLELDSRQVSQLTFSNLPALAHMAMVVPETINFPSFDNLEIPALLLRPARPNGAGVLFVHGGPNDQNTYGWDIFTQYLVAKGYTVLMPNYRGSTGYGIEFERANYYDWGSGDLQDCLHGGAFLASQPGVRPGRIAVMGSSHGGYLVNCCLARDPQYRFACGVSKFGDANILSSWAQCSRRLRLYTQVYMGHPASHLPAYQRSSPILDVANVQKPLLIMHGLLDDIVPPEASEEWVRALRQAGKTFEYKTYANEPHGFLHRTNKLDAWARIERFLDWYLVPDGAE